MGKTNGRRGRRRLRQMGGKKEERRKKEGEERKTFIFDGMDGLILSIHVYEYVRY